jgi:hypothetical protein
LGVDAIIKNKSPENIHHPAVAIFDLAVKKLNCPGPGVNADQNVSVAMSVTTSKA